jgi:RNA polymerase sporulation-specific sigma factor
MRQQLIENNLNLVYHIVHKYYPNYANDEDIVQCGMLGLCKAADKWDETKSKFSTFASMCVINEIRQEFRRRAKHQGILSLDAELKSKHDGEKGNSDINTYMDLIVGDEDVPYFDVGIDLTKLNKTERRIVELLPRGLTQADIARELGISRQYVWKTARKIKALRGAEE